MSEKQDDHSAASHCYAEEIAIIDQYLFEVRNAISYAISVHVLAGALSMNRRRLKLQAIRESLLAQSSRVSAERQCSVGCGERLAIGKR